MNQIYRGGCECGAVLYEVELDFAKPCASVWQRAVKPGTFKLISGEERLSGVQFWAAAVHHFYCDRCGHHAFSHHAVETAVAHYTVDLRGLEGPRGEASRGPQERARRA